MYDYDKLNLYAVNKKKRIDEHNRRELEKEKKEDTQFVNYLFSFLEIYIIDAAEELVTSKKEKIFKSISVNNIIFGYKKTNYIMNKYEREYDEPIYLFMCSKIYEVESLFNKKLPAFDVSLKVIRQNGIFRADHRINILVILKK